MNGLTPVLRLRNFSSSHRRRSQLIVFVIFAAFLANFAVKSFFVV
jgi:hypothetical protein